VDTKVYSGSAVHTGKKLITAAHIIPPVKSISNLLYERKATLFSRSIVAYYRRPNFNNTFPCTYSKEDNAKICSLPPNNQILGYNERWSTEHDVAILDTEISAPVVPTAVDMSLDAINQVYLVGYPSYVTQRAYENKYKSVPPRPYLSYLILSPLS